LIYGVSSIILFSGFIIGALLVVSLIKKEQSEYLKLFLFCGMVVPTVLTTVFLAAATVAENQSSVTGGPVHWHADFQIYSCDQPVKLKEPTGLSNRIGTPLLHEHGDNRIHVEGTVQDLAHVNLGNFFTAIGGQLTDTALLVPTDNGDFLMQNGMNCPESPSPLQGEGGGEVSLQIFVYKADETTKTITQEKLTNLPSYVLSPSSKVPPGDCIIIEFGQVKTATDQMCTFYKVALKNGEYSYSPPRAVPAEASGVGQEEGSGEVNRGN